MGKGGVVNFDFKQPNDVLDTLDAAEQSSRTQRQMLAFRVGVDFCYYEGVHYLNNLSPGARYDQTAAQTRLASTWNPNSANMHAVENEVSHVVHEVTAATYPSQFDVDAKPSAFACNQQGDYDAQIHEAACQQEMDEYGLLDTAREVNFKRSLAGTWVLGLAIENGELYMDGQSVPSQRLKFFDADPTNLILDPFCRKRRLDQHPYVIYYDTWTLQQAQAMFPGAEKIRPEDCAKISQLEPLRIQMSSLSGGRLFSRYAAYSNSEGVRVYQIHPRDKSGYYRRWYIVIETASGKDRKTVVNWDNPESPFGGCGMPFELFHGHYRSDTIWSWGDVAQVKDKQDKINMAATIFWRMIQRYGGPQWMVDKRVFGTGATDEQIRQKLTNEIGAVVTYSGGDKAKNHTRPELITYPEPPQFLSAEIEREREGMRRISSRAPGHEGQTPTHVPFKSTQATMDAADQPLGVRVSSDISAYERMLDVMHGTTILLAKNQNPGTLGMLRDAGFESKEFVSILQSDPYRIPVRLKIRESSVRYRSLESKKADLAAAAAAGMVDADTYAEAMVEYDTAISRQDAQMAKEATKDALSLLNGEPWEPKPWGKWGGFIMRALIRAQHDTRAKRDPKIGQRIRQAVQLQQQMVLQEAIASNPEMAMQQQEQQAAAAGGGNSSEKQNTQTPETLSISDLLAGLTQGGRSGVPA